MKKYFKIFLLLGAAFLVSDFGINNVFLAKSPKLNPFFAQNMIAKVNNSWSKTGNLIASLNPFSNLNFQPSSSTSDSQAIASVNNVPREIVDALTAPLTKVGQGVYAGERNNIHVYEIRSDEIDYLEYTFIIKGKEIKIKVPKDQQPPTQEVVESFYE